MSNMIRNTLGGVIVGTTLTAYTPQIPVSETEKKQINVLKDLATKNNTDLNKIGKNWEKWEYKREAGIQRTIDSLAYRQIFDQTQLSKDSNIVKEFNEISKKTAPHPRHSLHTYIQWDYDKLLKEMGCSEKEKNSIRSDCMKVYPLRDCGEMHFTKEGNINAVARHQYLTDSVAYSRFFKEKGILNSNTKQQIKKIALKIKP